MQGLSVNDILDSLGEGERDSFERVIYGVSDRSKAPFLERLNDFWIDRQSVPLKEKAYFFHLLSVMLDAGIPLLNALRILSDKTTQERFRRVLNTMAYHVQDGKQLSEVMGKFPMVFDETERGVVKSGEAIGRLDLMLARLSEQLEQTYDTHLKLKGALTYPAVVIVTLIAATLLVMIMVIPRLEVFFHESGFELPFLTRLVLGVSRFSLNYWWLFLIALLFAVGVLSLYGSTSSGRLTLDYWKLKLPFVGPLIQKASIVKFVRLLGVLTASGLPINKVLATLEPSIGNTLYVLKIRELRHEVERGGRIAEHLATTPFLFPETVTQILSIGEQSATLAEACEKLSHHYEQELEHTVKSLMTVLEPIVIILVGLAVAVLALAILGPVFSLSELV